MTQPQTNAQLAYSLGAVSNSLQQMKSSLASGDLILNSTVGDGLKNALIAAHSQSLDVTSNLGLLSTPAQLGANAVSIAITDKFVGRADHHPTALAPLLLQWQNLLLETKAVVENAMSAYDATETSIKGDFHGG